MRTLGGWLDRSGPGTEAGGGAQGGPGEDALAPPPDEGPTEPVHPEQVVAALRQIYDPEIPVNIYDLGLVYRVDVGEDGSVQVDMTLTAPGCPVAQEFPGMVEAEVCRVPGVRSARVEIVWEPPWTPDRMSEAAKLELGML